MKKLLFILLAMLAVSAVAKTTYVVKGNKVVAVADSASKAAKRAPILIGTYVSVTGKVYQVYVGPKGGIYGINSNGKRCSLPKEVKAAFEAIARKIK